MEHNGSALIGMAGKNCVALASDLTFNVDRMHVSRFFLFEF
jgi:20S proteasome alpha/beta subunit